MKNEGAIQKMHMENQTVGKIIVGFPDSIQPIISQSSAE